VNALLRAAIDEGLAALERVRDVPTGELGYGTDVAWMLDILEPMGDVDPTSTDAIAQAIIRRLDCPRGRLVDDADYGLDLVGYLNRGTTPAEVNGLAGAIRSEITKDDRIVTASVVVVPSRGALSVRIRVTPASPTLGAFTLTLAATSAGVVLQEITR
jgi:hypothetical protein